MENFEEKNLDKEEKPSRRYWAYLLLFTILLFFATFGITYSIYKGDGVGDQEIETGQILFSYSDVSHAGNGIYLINALPTSDYIGKAMVGTGQYFDFEIMATTKGSMINYKLLVKKDSTSTLKDNNVKLYLTERSGIYEKELVLKKANQLPKEVINDIEYYVLYEKILEEKLENYVDSYRLRMWVDEQAFDYFEQSYTIKVDVHAVQVEE